MYSFQSPQGAGGALAATARGFQRVSVSLSGRLMLTNYEEYPCTALEMSPGEVEFACLAQPQINERVIAYMNNLGRLEGTVTEISPSGFTMILQATERKREKLAAQLTWLANKHELGLPEDRRHDRLTPRKISTEIVLEDGRRYACRLMDLSLSGAAIDIDIRPPLGTIARLGNMRGKIVRHFMEGVALEFDTVQSRETLKEFL
ncbi:PilZ domain-containing protein [Rhizobium halophilum]|uniref:PilZ domain-containing protein n=1 Tax=Rhizobium halophilum TaxID=2846852 RepID=UPI001EFC3BD2|nr:PilZ domain-containing protein [Rhizobium halophilum]MCF6368490.1 PilZ domain-containing protein [Rhizobium halophilum]